MDPLARSHLSSETASSSSTLKPLTGSDDQLCNASQFSAHIHPRGLHDSGRQSSLDSGIGIATSSQSSYSGSMSSYTGSLDTASQGGGEEFGSMASLPAPPPSSPLSVPPLSPPTPTPPPLSFNPEHSSAPPSSSTCDSRSSSRASSRYSDDYQIPNLLRVWYDTPKSLLHTLSSSSPAGLKAQHQAVIQHSHSWDSERVPPVDSERRSTPRPMLAHGDLVYGETEVVSKWQSHTFFWTPVNISPAHTCRI